MERISQREYVLLGYSPRRSFENSMKTSDAMDFSDVFGGPPRRYSIQETRTRYSFSEKRVESEKGTVFPLSGLDEKPVFGEESANRKSYSNDDFFDDIFKGDEAKSRRTSRDFFAASPGSRVLSPSRPLPPKAEPFSPSFPAQFSLPAKLTKAMDFSLLGSTNRSPYKNRDGNSNGISHEHTSNLCRFASQATDIKDETRINRPLHRPSPLPHEVSHNSQEASFETESDGKEMGDKMKNYSESKEVPLNNDQFHFSIYKWAGSGVPFFMPVGRRSKSRCKERFKTERCSSSNRRIQSESSDEKKMEPCNDVEEAQIKIPESNFFQSEGYAIPQGEAFSRKKTEEESRSKDETNVCSKNEKDTNLNKGKAFKIEPKPLHGLLNDENQGQGNTVRGNEKMDGVTNKANNKVNLSTSAKKHDAKRININRQEATKASLQSSATYTQDAFDRNTAKGKVRDFVKIFNQETSAKPKTDTASQSSRWKRMDLNGTENGANNAVRTDEEVHKLDKNKLSESFSREDDSFNKIKVKQEPHFKSSAHKTSSQSSNKKNASGFSDSFPSNYDNKGKIRDDSFRAYFLVEELTQVEDKSSQTNGDSEDIKAWNAKIQQWSNRRKRNIRSLLSTLQFVLWAESGWKPVALIDLIEGSAVKKAYQKALLCLHPDKLQQKGAAAHQKFIAEQVFDILQEAWDHFNLLGAI